jgi:thiamine biosynthesis lipoprotein
VSLTVADWPALGTRAQVAVDDPALLPRVRRVVEEELACLDAACSRFRADSELARVHAADGRGVAVGALLGEAVRVALCAARDTDGLVDPTVGAAMDAAGYDRDFATLPVDGAACPPPRVPGWRGVRLGGGGRELRLAPGVRLDLGATAKAWAADRCAAACARITGSSGVLVSLGGDIAVAGPAPDGGWPVGVGDGHAGAATVTVTVSRGGVATSSTTQRRWRRGGREQHHILDPRTGAPAEEVWRAVTVAADTCVAANTASTAAVILGAAAPDWLRDRGLPARLVAVDGTVVCTAGWPADGAHR